MTGIVFSIQRFCLDDGPGIRTAVFFKGCSMRCRWCHNPESLEAKPQLMVNPGCVGCGRCAAVCPAGARLFEGGTLRLDRKKCVGCGKCADVCPTGALEISGRRMRVDEVIDEIARDEPFYRNSGGGATFSGGEPLLQPEFLEALLAACREKNIPTAVETALNVPWSAVESVLPLVDLFLTDLKAVSRDKHREATGADNDRILDNYRRLDRTDRPYLVRIPVIPGFNDGAEAEEIIRFLRSLRRAETVEFMPFHNMAAQKYESLGLTYGCAGMEPPTGDAMEALGARFGAAGLRVL